MQNGIKKLIISILVFSTSIIFFGCYRLMNVKEDQQPTKKIFKTEIEISAPITESLLYQALDRPKNLKIKDCRPRSGIVPHHDLASELIADFFFQLSQISQPKTFIILGPNHADLGLAPVISGRVKWQTPFGSLTNNYPILNALEKNGQISFDQENFTKEHSIGVLTPFIKYYFPKSIIVPIILTSKNSLEDTTALAHEITKYLNKETFLIASLDFSHYLPSSLSLEKDQHTLQLINNKNYQAIAQLNSDYLDSPPALITFLKTNKLIGANQIKILEHTESGQLVNQPQSSSTSYFTMFFCEKSF